mmetsp:Transcript_4073/g.10363  ORF Transcript_4073/g.10363 Transcript_4073/m.10363 type:complete len:211 (-) Transcript_4073:316-948(-)
MSLMEVCEKSSREPETAMLNLRGRLAYSGLPRKAPVMAELISSHTARVSMISLGSTPAIGFPTRLRTLSRPVMREPRPHSRSESTTCEPSSSFTPRSWMFMRVVMSITPSLSPYGSTRSAKTRACLEVTTPLGTLSRTMNVFGACFPRWKKPAHLRRSSTSSRLRSSHVDSPERSLAESSWISVHSAVPSFSFFTFSILFVPAAIVSAGT